MIKIYKDIIIEFTVIISNDNNISIKVVTDTKWLIFK